jgi:hypothetical protein
VREQPVAAGEIDDPAAAEPAASAARHLPGLVELLPRQAARFANGPADPIEERVRREPTEIVHRQAVLRAVRERALELLHSRIVAPARRSTTGYATRAPSILRASSIP